MLRNASNFCTHKVTIAPTDRPWDTIVVERFDGSTAERDAKRFAQSLEGLENSIVQVSCQQCW
jgi:hypothetical protein